MPRFHCPLPLTTGDSIGLPPNAARHVQVLRLQPGAVVTLFNGEGGEFEATVQQMGRSHVQVQVGAHHPIEREAPRAVHLLVGMPANERMDWLVEKATELGVASIQPVVAERSVLKLKGERAEKKRAHWQGIAVAACEQCGRNRVPAVHEAMGLVEWLALEHAQGVRMVLSLQPGAQPLSLAAPGQDPVTLLSGPEGGLSPAEEQAALAAGFVPVNLGPRVLRSETAPLAVLARLV
ncbi:MAG: 16S rRNA (uracil(1498)-N(3))-methyltransferase [Proteobacteria bacterium]|jgi:16S rRNA (uracil1498-N3)-methyltransferase|nr:16S rRNA (uracil(1498)-N(3))-methyltransferase [Ramlibacter sp.]MCA0213711.1 16S rRNA (uracil(1498)-N(3))-methyltransferase [Pseudomonadota bacterium]